MHGGQWRVIHRACPSGESVWQAGDVGEVTPQTSATAACRWDVASSSATDGVPVHRPPWSSRAAVTVEYAALRGSIRAGAALHIRSVPDDMAGRRGLHIPVLRGARGHRL